MLTLVMTPGMLAPRPLPTRIRAAFPRPRVAPMHRSSDSPACDWDEVRRGFRRLLGALAGPADPALVDDLVQEACVRLLRAARREAVREPEALMTVLARRTWYDHLRRTVRTRERFAPLGDDHDRVPAPAPGGDPRLGDPAERLVLVVQEIFAARGADECRGLLRDFLAATNWRTLAERLGVDHAALRKRWSRCLAVARADLAADPDLAAWLD